MNNNIFSPDRYCKYVKYRALGSLTRGMLAFAGGMLSALAFLIVIVPLLNQSYNVEYCQSTSIQSADPMWGYMDVIFIGGLYVVCALGASYMFASLSNKAGRISTLTLPASNLEKYLANWLICVPVVMVAYFVAFEMTDLLRITVLHIIYPDSTNIRFYNFWDSLCDIQPLSWAVLVLVQATFVLGSIVWPKLSAAKTLLAVLVVCVCSMLYIAWLVNLILDPMNMVYTFDSQDIAEPIAITHCYVIAAAIYVISYFRFKEIEIIQRW